MLPADAADANPTFPSFGLLGSTAAFVPIPVGNATVKLSRTVGNEVVYAPPPAGHGLNLPRWDKDPLGGPNGYALKLPTAEVRSLVSVRNWRNLYAASFPDGWVSNRHSPAAKQLTEFARGLLNHTAALHEHGWRLGLLTPDTVYLSSADPARVFLPDLGFAWVGQMALTKPAWLSAEPSDLHLWGEERKVRQFAAPEHYRTRHPAAGNQGELVQQDLRVVAQLLAFMLTGRVGGAEPAGGRRCPVWATIRAANADKFTGTPNASPAEQMLDHLLTGLKAPVETGTPRVEEKSGAGKVIAISVLLLALIGGGIAAWWLLTQKNPALASGTPTTDTETPTSGEGPSPTTGEQPPPTTPKPPDPTDPPGDLIELAKKEPQHPKVLAELDRLRKERAKLFKDQRDGKVDAARAAREVQTQIDAIQKAQNSPEPPK